MVNKLVKHMNASELRRHRNQLRGKRTFEENLSCSQAGRMLRSCGGGRQKGVKNKKTVLKEALAKADIQININDRNIREASNVYTSDQQREAFAAGVEIGASSSSVQRPSLQENQSHNLELKPIPTTAALDRISYAFRTKTNAFHPNPRDDPVSSLLKQALHILTYGTNRGAMVGADDIFDDPLKFFDTSVLQRIVDLKGKLPEPAYYDNALEQLGEDDFGIIQSAINKAIRLLIKK